MLLDILMEEMDGLETLQQIIEYDPEAKVIVVSSVADEKTIGAEARRLGAKSVFLKPPTDQRIKEALKELGER